jgi:hypothetical protein
MRTAIVALLLSAALVFAAEPTVAIPGRLEPCRSCAGQGFGFATYPNADRTKNRKLKCGMCDGEGNIIVTPKGGHMKAPHTPKGDVIRAEVHVGSLEEQIAAAEKALEAKRAELAKARDELTSAKAVAEKL